MPLYVLSRNNTPIGYSTNNKDALDIMWSMARREALDNTCDVYQASMVVKSRRIDSVDVVRYHRNFILRVDATIASFNVAPVDEVVPLTAIPEDGNETDCDNVESDNEPDNEPEQSDSGLDTQTDSESESTEIVPSLSESVFHN